MSLEVDTQSQLIQELKAEVELRESIFSKVAEVCDDPAVLNLINRRENAPEFVGIQVLFKQEQEKTAEMRLEIQQLKLSLDQVFSGKIQNLEEFIQNLREVVSKEMNEKFAEERNNLKITISQTQQLNEELVQEIKTGQSNLKAKFDEERGLKKLTNQLLEDSRTVNNMFNQQKVAIDFERNRMEKRMQGKEAKIAQLEKELLQTQKELKEFRDKELSEMEEEGISPSKKLTVRKIIKPIRSDRGKSLRVMNFLRSSGSPSPRNRECEPIEENPLEEDKRFP